ncbi:FtsX-like permease family protein [Streptomyces sp. BPTC-684]|uniref:FtsX-like permease family protein n=1 Tax=Streptomyces sp. BPTC-684 TaxID=3043734 RepID=UPI0024B1E342|nr:FtsX-like permease family protein [Streptomyces sp. BPTC-684]WHM38685.1 FtsX-like permease family protein [Streptomyces sp. BPTC-684]
MTGFVFLRVRAHRLLLAAALLAVLLTTSVLAALTAFSGSIGDAALRHTLATRSAAPASLIVKATVPEAKRQAADAAVREGARRTFDGLPVTTRTLTQSGPYALPRTLQSPDARKGTEPDLTLFAAVDRTRVRLTGGSWPAPPGTGREIQAALPENAAAQLGLRHWPVSLTLADRLNGPAVRVRVTGVYRPVDATEAYWQLDDLGGRGTRRVNFTTYGPLLTDPTALTGGRLSAGQTSWLASADFSALTTHRIGALRAAATRGPKSLVEGGAFAGDATATTALPDVLDRAERSLLVSRSTLLIVALQLVLLAGYALLLVARLLSSERTGETELLRARGGSRARLLGLSATEALLLAAPAAVCAPLLSDPLTRLLAGHGPLARIGVRLDTGPTGTVWLVAALVALGCAAAVVAPALSAGRTSRARAAALPAAVRAGADIGLLVIAGVAYWQLDRQTSGSGALSGDRAGSLGIDPLLVAAPALALLAGTVLTLRLLPPAAKLAERRAAGGRGLPAALAGWQFSRRPLRGAGPVLLLVLAVAMGMLAIGQSASWDRSQEDQADFRAGTSVRVFGSSLSGFGQAGSYDKVPGVRAVAPAARSSVQLSGDRSGTVLALDTAHADGLLLRHDLGGKSARALLSEIGPPRAARPGVPLPADAAELGLSLRLDAEGARGGASPSGVAVNLTAVVEDRFGIQYRLPAGNLEADGRPAERRISLDLAAGAPVGRPAAPLALTGFELDFNVPYETPEQHRLTVRELRTVARDGRSAPVALPAADRWRATSLQSDDGPGGLMNLTLQTDGRTLSLPYTTGSTMTTANSMAGIPSRTVRLSAVRPAPPALTAIATDRFLASSGTRVGQTVTAVLAGQTLRAKVVDRMAEVPTTGPGAETTAGGRDGGTLLLDLSAVNQRLAVDTGTSLAPTEWWLATGAGDAARAAAVLRARPDIDPQQVVVRAEVAEQLRDDPLGAGPQAALVAAAIVAAALAAVGFAVAAAGSLRERGAEFAVLRALGAPRRQLARLIAAEQGVLIGLALLVGLALGEVLTRAVVPLIVLTGQATQPVPKVLVELPAGRLAVLLAGVAAVPLLIVATLALRRTDPAVSLRHQGDN